eukprot:1480340-Pleurochrysis_carterae.AAC.6
MQECRVMQAPFAASQRIHAVRMTAHSCGVESDCERCVSRFDLRLLIASLLCGFGAGAFSIG